MSYISRSKCSFHDAKCKNIYREVIRASQEIAVLQQNGPLHLSPPSPDANILCKIKTKKLYQHQNQISSNLLVLTCITTHFLIIWHLEHGARLLPGILEEPT